MALNVAICIITCHRPHGLEKLLDSLNNLTFSENAQPNIHVVVVDNDPQGSAEDIVSGTGLIWPHTYVVEQEKGIPFARNRCMEIALEQGSEWIAFLDDDEYCDAAWLDALLAMQKTGSADVVWGPVFPVYESPVPAWMEKGGFYDRWHYENGQRITSAATNNVFFRTALVTEGKLRFNTAMRHTGGTDHLFFKQAVQRGYNIVWASEAKVWEDIPENRLTEAWLCKRFLRLGNTHTLTCLYLDSGWGMRIKVFVQGMLRFTLGALAYPATWLLPKQYGMKIKRAFFRGVGMLSALCNIRYQEYKNN